MLDVKAVLFDFDNTLVDSALYLAEARRQVAREIVAFFGNSLDVERVYSVLSRVEEVVERQGVFDRDRVWEHVLTELGLDGKPGEDVIRRWTELYWTIYMKGPLFPETVSVLETLKKRYLLGMVTNTDGLPGMKNFRLMQSGVLRFFDAVVVAGEDVYEVKPSPIPFLKAAEKLKLSPRECLMVGDDPVNDVAGAKAAGMYAALVDRRGEKPCPIKPDYVVRKLDELLRFLDV